MLIPASIITNMTACYNVIQKQLQGQYNTWYFTYSINQN